MHKSLQHISFSVARTCNTHTDRISDIGVACGAKASQPESVSENQRTRIDVCQFYKFIVYGEPSCSYAVPMNRRSTRTLRIMRRPEAHRHAYEIYLFV